MLVPDQIANGARAGKPYMSPRKQVRQSSVIRIIAGRWKGRRITITTEGIRPTGDRVRETLFNWLMPHIRDARCLDLFAGTGAMGIEALSRGAELAVFIENYNNACSVIKQNITTCSLDNKATLIKWDIQRNLDRIKSFKPGFTLIFIDPPYNKQLIKPSLLPKWRNSNE